MGITAGSIPLYILSNSLLYYPNKLDYCSFLTPFEKLARSIKSLPIHNRSVNFDYIITRLKSIGLSSYYSYDSQQLPLNISKAELSALNNLCRNKDLIISRPDKRNGVVILNRQDYVCKVYSILEDASKFSPMDKDFLEICQKRENKLIRFIRDSLLKKKLISNTVYQDLFPSGSTPGILYGLPKVHKINCPVRPILSAIGTYNYKLAKFLVPLLQPITSNQFTVKDSFSFVNEISSYPNQSYFMASFDVASLFTNLPLNECIDLCLNKLFDNREIIEHNDCKFDKSNFRRLLSFAVKEIDGVAMGSPLGPSLTNMFMCDLASKFLDDCPSQFKPIIYRRYVDDTFCLFKNKEHASLFLKHINKYHSNIQFTVEDESNNFLPFLDILIQKEGSNFSTSLYRKPTFTGLYTDFSTLSPNNYKVNLISMLVFRAFNICSSYINFHNELLKIKHTLAKNCYPSSLIDNVIKKFFNERFSPSNKPLNSDRNKLRVVFCIPYLGQLSFRLRNSINKLMKCHYPDLKLQFLYKSPKRLSSLFKYKDLFPTLVCSNVIRVVAAMPLITVKQPGILRFAVVST